MRESTRQDREVSVRVSVNQLIRVFEERESHGRCEDTEAVWEVQELPRDKSSYGKRSRGKPTIEAAEWRVRTEVGSENLRRHAGCREPESEIVDVVLHAS